MNVFFAYQCGAVSQQPGTERGAKGRSAEVVRKRAIFGTRANAPSFVARPIGRKFSLLLAHLAADYEMAVKVNGIAAS
ncbi:MAG TPA: hypothetical protein VMP01_19900 [Pirellulaceae bacterium]|nr:hypothetical protein [Pirellulaceae bacterium]